MRRKKGQRGRGDDRNQGDPTEVGHEDEWLRLNSKDVIVFGGKGGQMGIRWGLMVTARRQIFSTKKCWTVKPVAVSRRTRQNFTPTTTPATPLVSVGVCVGGAHVFSFSRQ